MRAVVQRVSRAGVVVDGQQVGAIGPGLCVLLGVGPDDDATVADRLAHRVATLRVFADAEGKMNLDITAAGGEVLVVSQFTLHADTSRGHRPSFIRAAPPELAARLCDEFVAALRALGLKVGTGIFGAHMVVSIENDGPVTLVLSRGEPAWEADAG
jgi:D-tyrosyl-tRNA(Tyr) deacylase